MFIVQEKIIGENLNRNEITKEMKLQVKEIIAFFIDLYVQTFNGKVGYYPEFFSIHNYIFGHKEGENKTQDRVYLIDISPIFLDPLDQLIHDLEFTFRQLNLSREYRRELLNRLYTAKPK